jgi:hypothetical protein
MSDNTQNNVHGAEMYHEIQRLICEWRGQDACQQTAAIDKLVSDIIEVSKKYPPAQSAAAHDSAEAA